MNPERKAKKDFVKSIRSVEEYKQYIGTIKLTDEEREICDMVFLRGYDYRLIGDTIGLTERTVKHKVRKILEKI